MNKIFVRPALALAAVGVFTTVVTAGCAPAATTDSAGAKAKPVSLAAQVAPIDLSDERLTFVQKGATVTVSKKGTMVATVTLTSATYTATSARAVFSVDAKQPVLLDPRGFLVYDADGGENAGQWHSPRNSTLPAGRHELIVDFLDIHAKSQAIGWAQANGEAVWER
jgi:hypothetical protein